MKRKPYLILSAGLISAGLALGALWGFQASPASSGLKAAPTSLNAPLLALKAAPTSLNAPLLALKAAPTSLNAPLLATA